MKQFLVYLTLSRIAMTGYNAVKTRLLARDGLAMGLLLALICQLGLVNPAYALQDTATTYQYDAVGNLTVAISPLDSAGNPVKTTYGYDSRDNLANIFQAIPIAGQSHPQVQLDHDGQDQLSWVGDPNGNATTYGLTGLGETLTASSPDSGNSQNTYDAAGNLKTRTDANGIQARYSYDAQNRLARMDTYAGNPLVINGASTFFTYDGGITNTNPGNIGKLTKIIDESGYTNYNYDALGRLTYKGQFLNGGQTAWVQATYYGYGTGGTSKGKPVVMLYPSSNRITYGYDNAGRIASVNLNPVNSSGIGTNTAVAIPLLTNIKYTPTGQFASGTFGNSTVASPNTLSRLDDPDGRVYRYPLGQSQNGGTVRTLTYDPDSRVTAFTHTGSGTGAFAPANFNQGFTYDNLGRLALSTSASGNISYSYDANGNRTSKGTDNYTLDAFSNKLLKTAATAPNRSYDLAGNLITDGTYTYTYSAHNKLVKAQQGSSNTTTYLYNGLGQRVLKNGYGAANNNITQYVYDEAGHLIGEYDFYGNPVQETVYLGDLPIAVLRQAYSVDNANAVRADNSDTAKVAAVGSWPLETTIPGAQGNSYQTHVASTGSTDSFTWKLTLPNLGKYWVQMSWTGDSTRATSAVYTATGTDGTTTRTVNQRSASPTATFATLGWKSNITAGSVLTVVLSPSPTGTVSADTVVAYPLSFTTSIHYVYADHINTPRAITRATDNQMVWRWDNADPSGLAQPNPNPANLGAFTYNPRFPGQVYDPEANLDYNYHRHYDPATGSYTQPDPIGLNGGLNTYSYVGGNPVNLTDPTGQFAQILIPGAVIGTGVAAILCASNPSLCQKAVKGCFDGIKKMFNSPFIDPKDVAGKTPNQIDKLATGSGLIPKGPDPQSGQGAYVDPETGEQRILCHPNCNDPHAHVNDPSGQRLDINGNAVPPESPDAHLPISK